MKMLTFSMLVAAAAILPAFTCSAQESRSHPRAQVVQGNLEGVDLRRLDDALDGCDYLLEHLTEDGRYQAKDLWGPESDLYVYGLGSVLVEAYRISNEEKYLSGARKVFDYLQRKQLPNGGWTLNLSGTGQEFQITEQQRRRSWKYEVLPAIGAYAYAIGKYRRVTGDNRYNAMIDRAIDRLMQVWDEDRGLFIEKHDERRDELRSDPITYQGMFLLGLGVWQQWRPELCPIVERLTEAIRKNYQSFDERSMPFMRVLHAALLMRHGSRDYAVNEIKPRLDELVHSRVFKCSEIPGGYGHRDGVRGIVASEANCRGSGAVALGMKLYDLTTNTRTYRDSEEYRDVAGWIDSMKAEHGYFGYQTQHDMKRKGRGSPAQFIPCWWIFGTL